MLSQFLTQLCPEQRERDPRAAGFLCVARFFELNARRSQFRRQPRLDSLALSDGEIGWPRRNLMVAVRP